MDDPQIHGTIEALVAEEHELWQRESAGAASQADRERLHEPQDLARSVLGPAQAATRVTRGRPRPGYGHRPRLECRRELRAVVRSELIAVERLAVAL